MLPKSQRVRRAEEFDGIFSSGKVVHGRLLSLRYTRTDDGPKYGFIIGSKAIGNAVKRNRLKRRLREIIRKEQPELAENAMIAFVAKPPAAEASTDALTTEVFGLLKKATLVR